MTRAEHSRSWTSLLPALVLGLLGTVLISSSAASGPEQAKAKVNRYIGSQKCKNCHADKASGDQYTAWTHMKHAKAWETLASDEAKKVGKAKGVEDPQKADGCLKCHVTGFGKPPESFDKSFDLKMGVQCESCHGPGEAHVKARIAAAGDEEEGEGFGDDKQVAKKYTKIPETEILLAPPMSTCLSCHNSESPSFKPFCFQRCNAEVRHLNPAKPRTAEELAKILACGKGADCKCVNGVADECKCAVPDPQHNKK